MQEDQSISDRAPLVSVTICCYNSEQWLGSTIQSVLNQTFQNFEIVIVNDGSIDQTEAVVKNFDDPRIRYVWQENKGLAATRNRTIELSRGEYIAFLDHDDLWEPEKLEIQINMLEQNGDTAFVYSNCYLIEADGSRFGNYFETWDNTPFSGHILEPLLTRGCFIPLPSVMIRKKVLVEVGGFNTGYRFVEDYDIWLRIAARHRVDYTDKELCSYRIHDKMTSRTHDEVLFEELLDLLGWWSHQPDLLPHVRLELAERCSDSLLSLGGILRQRGRKTEIAGVCARAFWNGPKGLIWRTTMKGMGRVLSKIGKNFTPSRPVLRD